jgi:hypothetical protein
MGLAYSRLHEGITTPPILAGVLFRERSLNALSGETGGIFQSEDGSRALLGKSRLLGPRWTKGMTMECHPTKPSGNGPTTSPELVRVFFLHKSVITPSGDSVFRWTSCLLCEASTTTPPILAGDLDLEELAIVTSVITDTH